MEIRKIEGCQLEEVVKDAIDEVNEPTYTHNTLLLCVVGQVSDVFGRKLMKGYHSQKEYLLENTT